MDPIAHLLACVRAVAAAETQEESDRHFLALWAAVEPAEEAHRARTAPDGVQVTRPGPTAQRFAVDCPCGAGLSFTARDVRWASRGDGLRYGCTGERVVECPECDRPVIVSYKEGVSAAVALLREDT